jgi:hypothetical protein
VAPPAERYSDADLDQLDDERDRDELRRRYYGLLQELRVLVPGVQVLLAFLFTVPFAKRFPELDEVGRGLFAVTLVSAASSVVCFVAPTVLHRAGDRQARQDRLEWGIRLTVAGIVGLGVSTVAGLLCVTRLIYGGALAWGLALFVAALIVVVWIALPRHLERV